MIVSNYAKLFSIEFRHDAYRDFSDILRDITVIPDVETLRIMNGSRIYWKICMNTLFCFVETITSINTSGGALLITTQNKPHIRLNGNEQLSLNIYINAGYFLNASDLRLVDTRNKVFHLSNATGIEQDSKLYLSRDFPYLNQNDLALNTEKETCFATVKISFQKNLANGFSLLDGNNNLKGKDYRIHINKN